MKITIEEDVLKKALDRVNTALRLMSCDRIGSYEAYREACYSLRDLVEHIEYSKSILSTPGYQKSDDEKPSPGGSGVGCIREARNIIWDVSNILTKYLELTELDIATIVKCVDDLVYQWCKLYNIEKGINQELKD